MNKTPLVSKKNVNIKPYDDEGKLCKLYVKKLEKVYGFKYDYNRVNTDDEDIEENLWEH